MTHRPMITHRLDVLDGPLYQAYCPACLWEGTPVGVEVLPRIQIKEHLEEVRTA